MSAPLHNRPVQLLLIAGAFAAGTVVAKLAGDGWGTAASIGQIVFVAVLVAVLLSSSRPGASDS